MHTLINLFVHTVSRPNKEEKHFPPSRFEKYHNVQRHVVPRDTYRHTRYRSILKPIPNECHDAWPSLGSICTSVKFKLKIKGAVVVFEKGVFTTIYRFRFRV